MAYLYLFNSIVLYVSRVYSSIIRVSDMILYIPPKQKKDFSSLYDNDKLLMVANVPSSYNMNL